MNKGLTLVGAMIVLLVFIWLMGTVTAAQNLIGDSDVDGQIYPLKVTTKNPLWLGNLPEGFGENEVCEVDWFPLAYRNYIHDAEWQEKNVNNDVISTITVANLVQTEKLQTMVRNTGYEVHNDVTKGNLDNKKPSSGLLITRLTANFVGISHIGFAVKDPQNPHHTIAIGREETSGNFHIEKTIEIRQSCSEGRIGSWLGCP
jgi:hypothetical protein